MDPRVGVAAVPVESPDGIFTIGREAFPHFSWYARLGVPVQSDQVRVAHPDSAYVQTALDALAEACRQLDVPSEDFARAFEEAST